MGRMYALMQRMQHHSMVYYGNHRIVIMVGCTCTHVVLLSSGAMTHTVNAALVVE
jgi:hypothetical protein